MGKRLVKRRGNVTKSVFKKYALKIVDQFLQGEKVDKIFKTSLRNLLEILTPRRGDTNKNRWYKTKWWEKFLTYDETMDFSLAERDVMLGDLLSGYVWQSCRLFLCLKKWGR